MGSAKPGSGQGNVGVIFGMSIVTGLRASWRHGLLVGGIAGVLSCFAFPGLAQEGLAQEEVLAQQPVSLADYDLEAGSATHWRLPGRLREISGLATTRDHRLLAHNDEAGVIYEIDFLNGSIVKQFQMADMADPVADDFEGIAVADDQLFLVTSSGRIYETREGAEGESVLYRVYATGVGRECEIEGLAYDAGARELLLMCKDARNEELEGRLPIYRWSIDRKRLNTEVPVMAAIPDFTRHIGSNRYRPSGIERHPESGNYFVVAARPGAIAEVTPSGEVVAARRFVAQWHRQIEGIAFAADGALIVADEGAGGRARLTIYPAPGSRQ